MGIDVNKDEDVKLSTKIVLHVFVFELVLNPSEFWFRRPIYRDFQGKDPGNLGRDQCGGLYLMRISREIHENGASVCRRAKIRPRLPVNAATNLQQRRWKVR